MTERRVISMVSLHPLKPSLRNPNLETLVGWKKKEGHK